MLVSMDKGKAAPNLQRKLGIKPGMKILVTAPPPEFDQLITPLPPGTEMSSQSVTGVGFILVFTRSRAELEKLLPVHQSLLTASGMLWIAWPKKSARTGSDLDENFIRDTGLASGLVDVKVCSVNEIWSALKFVYRLRDRKMVQPGR